MRLGYLAAAAFLVTLAGCVGAPSAHPGPRPTPTPTPTETAVAAGPVAPGAVLPATCDELVPATALEAQFGFVPSQYGPLSGYGLAANRQLGWAACSWYSSDASLSITFDLRHDGRTPPETQCHGQTSEYANCTMSRIVGGWRVRGQFVTGPGFTPSDPIAAMTALVQPVVDRLATETAPATWTRPDAVGPAILDCATISEPLDRSALGMPEGATLGDVTGMTEDGTLPRDEAAVGGETVCRWVSQEQTSGPAMISLSFLAGGAWAWPDLLPGPGMTSEAVEVAGADEAILECTPQGDCSVVARLGPDLARIVVAQGGDWGPGTLEQVRVAADEILASTRTVVG